MHAARHYGVHSHGVTLSTAQLSLARQRIAQAGLEDRVTVELRDYRNLQGDSVYDKVASVGMFEHVGLKNLPVNFLTVHRLLKPGGLFLHHGITHDVESWNKTTSTEFINRCVFPEGQLDTVSNIQRGMERAWSFIMSRRFSTSANQPFVCGVCTWQHARSNLSRERSASIKCWPASLPWGRRRRF